jgi:hypothetical protein
MQQAPIACTHVHTWLRTSPADLFNLFTQPRPAQAGCCFAIGVRPNSLRRRRHAGHAPARASLRLSHSLALLSPHEFLAIIMNVIFIELVRMPDTPRRHEVGLPHCLPSEKSSLAVLAHVFCFFLFCSSAFFCTQFAAYSFSSRRVGPSMLLISISISSSS